ncbi:hypothetical protein C1M55_28160 [Rhodococcus qingshengii]|uniref:hypothetical protein n=1 Tax=Rhodococcus TaxID=1827 RepID=UPI000C9F1D62|nr:hypothetical protein [Rhodococcus qingshengii]AUS34606.1 hypothetical protein C1M55_28160 [Rhodococcus qingshengii]
MYVSYCNPYDFERAHGYKPGEEPNTDIPQAVDDGTRQVMTTDGDGGSKVVTAKVVTPDDTGVKTK